MLMKDVVLMAVCVGPLMLCIINESPCHNTYTLHMYWSLSCSLVNLKHKKIYCTFLDSMKQ